MFLTLEDPNAKVKGSRDPLGSQPIWAAFGRHVVANLTMQTTSTRGFTILLLGRYFGIRLIEKDRAPREAALDIFLRMEQIGAYARHVAHGVEGEIRGIDRVKTSLAEKKRVDIQADRRGYILGDQKVTGLWGLYSVAARISGLISPGPVGVEPAAVEFVEAQYLPRLEPALNELLRLLERGGSLTARRGDALFGAVSSVLPQHFTPAEERFYGEYLRDARHVRGFPDGRQERFRELLEKYTNLEGNVGREEVFGLIEAASEVDPDLSHRLERIARLEAVLAPAGAMFDFMLTRHGLRVGEVAKQFADLWGDSVPNIESAAVRELLPEVAAASNETIAKALDQCQVAMCKGKFADAAGALLDWNKAVMRERNAGRWVAPR